CLIWSTRLRQPVFHSDFQRRTSPATPRKNRPMNIRSLKLLPLAAALVAAPMLAHGEDLMDAYQQALSMDPVLAQQVAQRNSTRESVPLSRAQLLPHLSAGLSLQQTNGGSG